MTDDILTIAFDGDITLADFSEAMKRFQSLVDALSQEVGGKTKVNWRIDDLQVGSAIATVRGISPQPEITERVIRAFATVGGALQRHESIPFSAKVRKRADGIMGLVKGSIISIRFETPFSDALITGQTDQLKTAEITYAYGQVRGIVQTLTRRRGLKFTLYDSIFDKPISCYVTEDQEDIMRGIWGRKVIVSGRIGREPSQKRPVVVRQIHDIEVLDDVPAGSYSHARGALSPEEESAKPEAIIRGIRDAW